jgi:hypothetical protein
MARSRRLSNPNLNPWLGLVVCPTRFGLEVVHVAGVAAAKGVPLGSIVASVGGVPLGEAAAEDTFRTMVGAALPRPVRLGFTVPAAHKAVLQQRVLKLEHDLRAANDAMKTLRAGKAPPPPPTKAAPAVGGAGAGRSSLQQRQDDLKKKQDVSKAGAGVNDADLPDYLKHLTVGQKKLYLYVIHYVVHYVVHYVAAPTTPDPSFPFVF